MGLDLTERLQSYIGPFEILMIAVYAGLRTILDLVIFQGRPLDVLNYSKWRDPMFERAWKVIGPGAAEAEEDSPVPSLIYEAYGTVLELGPGDGQQISRLDPSKITKIYGIEPNLALHPELRTSIAKAGLENIYTIVPCGIEDRAELRKYGIESEGMDTILSIKVLCSVPEPERMTRELYRLLKPGGQLLLSEHVRSRNVLSRLIQEMYNIAWPHLLAHCQLTRPTDEYLMKAGNWDKVDFLKYKDEKDFEILPHICGRLMKPK
ncbi:hypothetical protein MMC08_004284 [Hypocenomyce scalaris]|nr:hypothetical protein [Hypocenomyce scalaris]